MVYKGQGTVDDGAVVFMDTETLGLDKAAPIWEFAAVRVNSDGTEEEYHSFIHHTVYKGFGRDTWLAHMPPEFADDYKARYQESLAIHAGDLVDALPHIYRGRAHTVGAVPNFDTERLGGLCEKYGKPEPWHYHLIDIENLVAGYLMGRGDLVPMPWKSDVLSRRIGVDPNNFDRHTAMGDVLWVKAQYDAITEAPSEWQAGIKDILSDVAWAANGLRTGRLRLSDIPHELHDLWHGYWA